MRILLTTDTIGGVWTYTRDLSEGLLQSGIEVCLVSLGRLPDLGQKAWTDGVKHLYPHTFRYVATDLPLEWMQGNETCFTGGRDLLMKLVQSFEPDLLHANQLCFGALAVDTPKLVVHHSDVVTWFAACRGEAPPQDAWFLHYLEVVTQGLRNADCVVAPTAWMLGRASQVYGPLHRSQVIPNGRTLGPDLRTHPTSARKLQAITAGRMWDRAKNLSLLEEVSSPIPILVAGECSFESSSASSSSGNVTCLGNLSEAELLKLMAESSIYIVPSIYEPFGLAPLEAALSGCALLAIDIASLREVWGEAAIYFTSRHQLSQQLAELASNPVEIRRLASAAGSRARELYSRERMTDQYLHLYRDLVHQDQARSELHVA